MKNAQPLFNPATRYRIELQGRVEVDWLQNFDSAAEVSVDETSSTGAITVLELHTDQSGVVGLVRRLHGLGMEILNLQIVSDEDRAVEVKEQL